MRSSVASRFRAFNEPIEGVVNFMYLDVKGLVTIGVGNLIDPMSVALALPFRHKSKPGTVGRLATRAEIEAEWKMIKGMTDLARLGHRACAPLTTLELDDTAINEIIRTRLTQNESFLKRQKPFLKFEEWPADAQMALLSMAWAMGPGFSVGWVNFHPGCEKMDFDQAAANCKINETGNPGVAHRNRANVHLFKNAAVVLAGEATRVYRREELYYPRVLVKPAPTLRGDQRVCGEYHRNDLDDPDASCSSVNWRKWICVPLDVLQDARIARFSACREVIRGAPVSA